MISFREEETLGISVILYMNGKTKTMTLDACVDGNVDHLTQLVGDDYDQFSTFFQIYKNIPTECHGIQYSAEQNSFTFQVECEPLPLEDLLNLKRIYELNGILIDSTDRGLTVNIPIR